MIDTKGIILIHGAGLGSFIWDELKQYLSLPVLAVDFPNRKGGDKVNLDLSLHQYCDSVIKEIKNWNKSKIFIVTHSIGGLVGLKVGELLSDQIAGFIAISSVIPRKGSSFVSSLPFPKNLIMNLVIRFAGTKPPESAIVQGLCNDLSAEQTKMIVENFTPEARSLYLEKIDVDIPNARRLYVQLTADKELPISLQDQMAKNLRVHEVISIDSGHLPMLSRPKELANIINEFVDRIEHLV